LSDTYISDQLSFGKRTVAEVQEAARLFIETMYSQAASETEAPESLPPEAKPEDEETGWSPEDISQFEESMKAFREEGDLAGMTNEEMDEQITNMKRRFYGGQ
jgi:hypothetical protein